MTIVLNGTTGITNDGGYTGDGISFADTTPANTLVTDTSGNVGVGTASPVVKLHVAGSNGVLANFQSAGNKYGVIYTDANASLFGCASSSNIAGANYLYVNATDNYQAFITNSSERARIDSSGLLLVGTTNTDPTFNRVNGVVTTPNGSIRARQTESWDIGRSSTSGVNIAFYTDNGSARVTAGNISSNGSTTSYNTTSDYRMKENIAPMTGALATIQALKPITYDWKDEFVGTKKSTQGFIAHELQAVVPDCVTGEKDAVDQDGNPQYQGIDTSFLVATLTAAIQEQQAIITDLKSRIEALEVK